MEIFSRRIFFGSPGYYKGLENIWSCDLVYVYNSFSKQALTIISIPGQALQLRGGLHLPLIILDFLFLFSVWTWKDLYWCILLLLAVQLTVLKLYRNLLTHKICHFPVTVVDCVVSS